MPEEALCAHCERDTQRHPHQEWCPGHPDFIRRAEGIAQAALAALFVDFGLSPRSVTINVHAKGEGVYADVRVFMSYPQIEEAA